MAGDDAVNTWRTPVANALLGLVCTAIIAETTIIFEMRTEITELRGELKTYLDTRVLYVQKYDGYAAKIEDLQSRVAKLESQHHQE